MDSTGKTDGKGQHITENSQQTARQYRDTFFRYLFSERERALELYNALTDSNVKPNAKVEFLPSNGILARFNDLVYTIDEQLVSVCEQQSTPNPNMPLRQLQYVTDDVYSKYLKGKAIYGSKLIKIPTPRLFVLYNGRQPFEKSVLRLSDSFIIPDAAPAVEVIAAVINIRYDKKDPILSKSESIHGYSFLIDGIDKNLLAGMERDKAIEAAVDTCISQGILKEYLKTNFQEVLRVFNFTYDAELDKQVQMEEAMEEGIQIGENHIINLIRLMKQGKSIADIAKELNINERKVKDWCSAVEQM
jgi:hypothetical protein